MCFQMHQPCLPVIALLDNRRCADATYWSLLTTSLWLHVTLNKSSRIQDVNVSLEAAAKSFQSDNNKSLIQYEQNIFLKMNTLTKKKKNTEEFKIRI